MNDNTSQLNRHVTSNQPPKPLKHPPTIDSEKVLSRLENVTDGDGGQYSARCPSHNDCNNSLAVCVGDEKILLHCHAGCELGAVLKAVGLEKSDLFPSNGSAKRKSKIIATYDYRDENGNVLFQAVRLDPKGFRQRKPNPTGGWSWSVKGCRCVPYRLPELLAATDRIVIVVEGEKDADNLARRVGVVSTCNVGGAEKWTAMHSEFLQGRKVVILPDNDNPGRDHAQQVAKSLYGVAQWVRIVELPNLPHKGDASDWIANGGTKDELRELIDAVKNWTPPAVTDDRPSPAKPATSSKNSNTCRTVEPGTLVRAGDRSNYGTVVSDNGNSCLIHFDGEDGTADVELPKSDLTLCDGTPLAEPDKQLFDPIPIGKLIASYMTMADPVVEGLVRRGETLNIIAAPKVGKSWMTYDLCLSVASGGVWLGKYRCERGRVLLIDNELKRSTLADRIPRVAGALNIAESDYRGQLDVWPLRGRLLDLPVICQLLGSVEKGTYSLIILDALYRAWPPGLNENDNGAVAGLFNLIDAAAERLDAAWALIHHSSRGEQSSKAVTDVGAGAGSQSRAADCHLVLRPHQDPGCIVLEAVVRSSAPVEPIALRWDYPCWHPAEDVDPTKLKRTVSPTETKQREKDEDGKSQIIAALSGGKRLTARELRKSGFGRDRLARLLGILESEGRIASEATNARGNATEIYFLPEIENEKSEDQETGRTFF